MPGMPCCRCGKGSRGSGECGHSSPLVEGLLRRLLPEDALGDLAEGFQWRAATEGLPGARWWYRREASRYLLRWPLTMMQDVPVWGSYIENRSVRMFFARGRLAEGRSLEDARAELDGLGATLADTYPDQVRECAARGAPAR